MHGDTRTSSNAFSSRSDPTLSLLSADVQGVRGSIEAGKTGGGGLNVKSNEGDCHLSPWRLEGVRSRVGRVVCHCYRG